jgi:hypothetical protein
MRLIVVTILLLFLAGCQDSPGGSASGHRFDRGNRDGGMCSPYSSSCW